jgi:sulfoxide reductase heme-binding subunit YedZ
LINEILKSFDFQKKLLWVNGSLPAILLVSDLLRGNLGANPPEAIIRTTGVVAIIFLVLTLAVTPLASILKWTWTIKHRRWLGLWAFYYALLHLLAYSAFDKGFNFTSIILDIKKRPFILLGFLAFILMLPLAISSTNNIIRKMGAKKWRSLHKATYIIAILAAVHYWLIVKSDLFYPEIMAFFIAILLMYRINKYFRQTKLRNS